MQIAYSRHVEFMQIAYSRHVEFHLSKDGVFEVYAKAQSGTRGWLQKVEMEDLREWRSYPERNTILHEAVCLMAGDTYTWPLQHCLENGGSYLINKPDSNGHSPLALATFRPHLYVEHIRLLLEAGANPMSAVLSRLAGSRYGSREADDILELVMAHGCPIWQLDQARYIGASLSLPALALLDKADRDNEDDGYVRAFWHEERLHFSMHSDIVAEVRWRVYFRYSLVQKLITRLSQQGYFRRAPVKRLK